MPRCGWVTEDPLYLDYHDREWGKPVRDDRHLFEMLILEGAQAGLSWLTVLKKRAHYKEVFDNFDPAIVATYDEVKVEALLSDPGIIRNRRKIHSAIRNARVYLKIQEEFGSFATYLWSFTDGKVVEGAFEDLSMVPVSTHLSDTLSKDLKKRGMNFVGTTIIYSYLQAVGLVNDHVLSCEYR